MKNSFLTLLIIAVLVVAFLCAMLVKGGLVIWIPVLLALAVVGYLASAMSR